MSPLEEAILIAIQAHRGQRDKAGAPYTLHPLRVMLAVEGEAERICAVLHDVLEDSAWTLQALAARGFPPQVLEALDCLTRRPGEAYEAFVERVRANPLACRVKVADLEDNMDLRRIASPGPADLERLARYRRAWQTLLAGPGERSGPVASGRKTSGGRRGGHGEQGER